MHRRVEGDGARGGHAADPRGEPALGRRQLGAPLAAAGRELLGVDDAAGMQPGPLVEELPQRDRRRRRPGRSGSLPAGVSRPAASGLASRAVRTAATYSSRRPAARLTQRAGSGSCGPVPPPPGGPPAGTVCRHVLQRYSPEPSQRGVFPAAVRRAGSSSAAQTRREAGSGRIGCHGARPISCPRYTRIRALRGRRRISRTVVGFYVAPVTVGTLRRRDRR